MLRPFYIMPKFFFYNISNTFERATVMFRTVINNEINKKMNQKQIAEGKTSRGRC